MSSEKEDEVSDTTKMTREQNDDKKIKKFKAIASASPRKNKPTTSDAIPFV